MPDYKTLAATIDSLTHGETDEVALMATLACEIHHSDARFDWTGFYRVTAPELLKIAAWSFPLRAACAVPRRGRARCSWFPMSTLFPAISPALRLPGRNWCCRCSARAAA